MDSTGSHILLRRYLEWAATDEIRQRNVCSSLKLVAGEAWFWHSELRFDYEGTYIQPPHVKMTSTRNLLHQFGLEGTRPPWHKNSDLGCHEGRRGITTVDFGNIDLDLARSTRTLAQNERTQTWGATQTWGTTRDCAILRLLIFGNLDSDCMALRLLIVTLAKDDGARGKNLDFGAAMGAAK